MTAFSCRGCRTRAVGHLRALTTARLRQGVLWRPELSLGSHGPSAIGKKEHGEYEIFGGKCHNNDIGLENGIYTALFTLKEGFKGQMMEKTKEILYSVPCFELPVFA
ncbi:hypothetical protein C8J57DRAFT_1199566 [Mycena rebaudengoi]|nr:hypothetical protein C8J57DRAFT_1199566 [Mycena rebaudengoi]